MKEVCKRLPLFPSAQNADAAAEAFVAPEGLEFVIIQELDGFLVFGGDSGWDLLFFLAVSEGRHAFLEIVVGIGTAGGQLDHVGELEGPEGGDVFGVLVLEVVGSKGILVDLCDCLAALPEGGKFRFLQVLFREGSGSAAAVAIQEIREDADFFDVAEVLHVENEVLRVGGVFLEKEVVFFQDACIEEFAVYAAHDRIGFPFVQNFGDISFGVAGAGGLLKGF